MNRRVIDVAVEIRRLEQEDERLQIDIAKWEAKEKHLKEQAEKAKSRREEQAKIYTAFKESINKVNSSQQLTFPHPRLISTNSKLAKKLYIITTQNKWPVKIGVSYLPVTRVKDLQTANWEKLEIYRIFECPGNSGHYLENILHKKLRLHSMTGEWFNLTAEEAEFEIWKVFIERKNLFSDFEIDITCL